MLSQTHTHDSLTIHQSFLRKTDLLQIGMKEEPALGGVGGAEGNLHSCDVDLGQVLCQSVEANIVTGPLLDPDVATLTKLYSGS